MAQPIVCGFKGIQIICAACGKWTWKIGAWVDQGKYYHEACVPQGEK